MLIADDSKIDQKKRKPYIFWTSHFYRNPPIIKTWILSNPCHPWLTVDWASTSTTWWTNTNTHTHTQNDYHNPHACAPRVNYTNSNSSCSYNACLHHGSTNFENVSTPLCFTILCTHFWILSLVLCDRIWEMRKGVISNRKSYESHWGLEINWHSGVKLWLLQLYKMYRHTQASQKFR